MKREFVVTAALITMLSTIVVGSIFATENGAQIVGLTAEQIRWFTPSYYNDGRQRAHLLGDSSKGGTWVDRVRIPGGVQFSPTRIRKTNRSQLFRERGIWAKAKDSMQPGSKAIRQAASL